MDELIHRLRSPATAVRWTAMGVARASMWASLIPLALMLRPYEGLAQDARIYLGRGVADHDPSGVGLDTVFVHDGQNGFSIMARVVGALLKVTTPDATSLLIATVGLLAWLTAATVLALRLSRGLTAWAIAVALLALPSIYGGFGTFAYGETLATPRTLAEAAVLGGFAALLSRRNVLGLAFMLAAVAAHPLMALPGIAVAAVVLIEADRRWIPLFAAVLAVVMIAAFWGMPPFGRLLTPFDPVWASVIRQRSVNLFPSLWSASVYVDIARRLATALLAASFLSGRPRTLVLAGCGVSLAGLGVAALLGDVWMMELVTQLQPWRSLWLLAVLGNAGFVISAVHLWRGGHGDRLTLVALAAAWLTEDVAPLQAAAIVAVLVIRVAVVRGWTPRVPPRLFRVAGIGVLLLMVFGIAQSAMVTVVLLRVVWASGGDPGWHLCLDAGLTTIPVMTAALALACAPRGLLVGFAAARPRATAWGCMAGLAAACIFGLYVFDQTSAERGADAHRAAVAALRQAIGPAPGEVMWIDEDDENWFLAGRPTFFDTVQGAPILFSRTLALDWADRAATVRSLGWAREIDISPWTAPKRRLDPILLRLADLETFCRNPRRPAAVVAPGDQRDAAPPGWTALLWRPDEPFHRTWIDDDKIRRTDWNVFTVVRCPRPAPAS